MRFHWANLCEREPEQGTGVQVIVVEDKKDDAYRSWHGLNRIADWGGTIDGG